MLDLLSFVGLVVDGIPILRWALRPIADRRLEIELTELRGLEVIANEWLAMHRYAQHRLPFVLPFVLTARNHNHQRSERLVSIGVRIKRRRGLRSELIASAQIVDLQRVTVRDIWVEPLRDTRIICFAEGSITARMLYNLLKGQPVVVELVLRRVGGIVRTYYCRIPWEWVCVPPHVFGVEDGNA